MTPTPIPQTLRRRALRRCFLFLRELTAHHRSSAKVIEDDYITVYGTCDGTHTYETVMGASVTIPAIDAEKIIIGRK